MKYPQLVSTKAVNEISDWLIKRLEDLDIEHPGVYSRLLLSLLLHTPSKVNAIDLLEDLKEPYRFTNKNNEELKRLAAVESLMEVSAEENKSSIVNLVDELHSKLRKFESSCEDSSMSSSRSTSNSLLSSSPKHKDTRNLKKIKRNHGVENSTKNYYLAFPALSAQKKMAAGAPMKATANDFKPLLAAEFDESNKKSNLLSWSNLMTKNKKETTSIASLVVENDKSCVKTPTRRKRRYGKTYNNSNNCSSKGFPKKNDVQFTAKSFTMYDSNATFSPKKMVRNSSSNKKQHQRNHYDASIQKTINHSNNNINNSNNNTNNKNCGIRNNNFFSNAQNAPKMDDLLSGSGAPWDMDFKGHWEMDRDLISEFIQQQKEDVNNYHFQGQQQPQQHKVDQYDYLRDETMKMKYGSSGIGSSNNNINNNTNLHAAAEVDDTGFNEDDDMLMKCLPTKLMVDDPFSDDKSLKKPCNNKEMLSISSLKSKFDENVKAIWSDGVADTLKPLTYRQQQQQQHFEDDASLASSFTSEKNSLSLFNFNEQQQQQQQQLQTHHFEVSAPSCTEIYQQNQMFNKNIDYDCNNNNPMVFFHHGGRGAISKSSSFNASPRQFSYADYMSKSDFIKSGTNLQTSIWSDGGDFASDAESLILKEVADPKISTTTDAIYSNNKHLDVDWQQQQDSNDAEVTLFNHSDRSAFKKFRPLQATTAIIRADYHPLNVDFKERAVAVVDDQESSADSAENYLTSEKTHFSPIIRDGHTFVIDNNWDEIEYERSPSGCGVMYKNKRYKIWNKNSKQPNIENDIDVIEMENESSSGEFIIKYILSENDKGCQVNESDFVVRSESSGGGFLEINEEYCKRKIYDEYFKETTAATESRNKWRYVNNAADDSNDYSFFTVNRVKNNNNSNNNLTTQTFLDILPSSNSSSSSICTITSSQYDPSESWRNISNNNNSNKIENNIVEYKQTCLHRLWEQCMVCAQMNEDPYADNKSLPASHLMKHELQMDGDEIMNVIQNLYITDYCEDDEEKEDDCEEFDMSHVYNMIMDDDAMEDENKFYETSCDVKNQKNLTAGHHHGKEVMNLENFDEMTLTEWQWKPDHEKYLKLLNWIKESLVKNNFSENFDECVGATADTNNNDCQNDIVHRPKNRKRRHSTCQNFLENKRYHSHEEGFTYHFNLHDATTPSSFLEDNNGNLFFDAAKMLKVNIEKILLIHADHACFEDSKESKNYKDQIGGANYYRNILQQQHALIKQLDLSRPLTR